MTERRQFIASIAALGGWLAVTGHIGSAVGAARVDAVTTVFYGHPDGLRNLVRFTVTGLDAPAGRLRVYDRARRLLGTAGMLRRDGDLYGELWLPLAEATTVVSELEAPGLRTPMRSSHSLEPTRRWTLHLLTAVDPVGLTRTLRSLPPIPRAVRAAGYRGYQVSVNPLTQSREPTHLEHVPFLQMANAAQAVEREFGIPMSDAAVIGEETLQGTAIMALAGSGVQLISIEHAGGEPFRWLVAPDGSRLLAVVTPPGGDAVALGFAESPTVMTSRVEEWLIQSPLFRSPIYNRDAAIIVNTASEQEFAQLHRSIASWNSEFAFPRITTGRSDRLLDFLEESRGVAISEVKPGPKLRSAVPSKERLSETAVLSHRGAAERTDEMLAVLAGLLGAEGAGIEAIAAEVGAIVPGTVVFNPSPFSRSELVAMTDGTERLATNVPGLGYAYFPDARDRGEDGEWVEFGSGYSLQGERFRITIDSTAGCIASMVDMYNDREWVRLGSGGLNGVEGSRLESISRSSLPGLSTRAIIRRWSPERGNLRTTVTVYAHSPWVDIENEAEALGAGAVQYRFDFALSEPMVSWEVPAGYEASAAPVESLEHVRWLRLTGDQEAMMLRCIDAPIASVEPDGAVLSYAPPGRSRYRLARETRSEGSDAPWVFGWGTEPFRTARVEPRGARRLPTFGNILDIERVGVAVLGLARAREGTGAIVYLQDLVGLDRRVSVAAGLVRFRSAREVDYLERDLGIELEPSEGRVLIPLRAHGVAAVRLSGLELNTD